MLLKHCQKIKQFASQFLCLNNVHTKVKENKKMNRSQMIQQGVKSATPFVLDFTFNRIYSSSKSNLFQNVWMLSNKNASRPVTASFLFR